MLLFNHFDSAFVKGVISNVEGIFVIDKVVSGNYYVEISMIGFQKIKSQVFYLDDHHPVNLQNFYLEGDAQNLDEITVVAKKPLFEQQIDRTVVNVQNSITATGATALSILERSPGIIVDRMNNQISMQGKQGVVVMLNGKRMRMEVSALIQLLQTMPSDNIEKIELITTPPASFDAEGNAGIINIVTIKKED